MHNKSFFLFLACIICLNSTLESVTQKSEEEFNDYLKAIVKLMKTKKRKKSDRFATRDRDDDDDDDDNRGRKSRSSKKISSRKSKKEKSNAEEFPQPEQPTAASRYNETISFIYQDAYDMAYELALLRVNGIYSKRLYLFARKEISKTNLIRTARNDDLSQTEFYSYYNTVFNACMDEFKDDCTKSAALFTAGFTNLKLIVTEIAIHYAVYKAFIDALFYTRKNPSSQPIP